MAHTIMTLLLYKELRKQRKEGNLQKAFNKAAFDMFVFVLPIALD